MKLSKTDLKKLNSITDKRPSTVIQHIIRHGFITTEELANDYCYEHAPRAARDVRERGVNLVTYRVKSSDGRNIAAYKFGILFLWTIKFQRWPAELHCRML